MDKIIREKCRNLLDETLNSLFLMERNFLLLESSLLDKVESILDRRDGFEIIGEIYSLSSASNDGEKREIIKKLENLTYKGTALTELLEFIEKNGSIIIKEKTNQNIFKELRDNVKIFFTNNASMDLNVANYCKNLFTLYEIFYTKLYKINCYLYPHKFLHTCEISIKELENLNFDRQKIIENIVENAGEELTSGSTKLSDVCEKFQINKNLFSDINDQFDEIYYRRNILTHGEGKVSKDYEKHVSQKLKKRYIKNGKLDFPKDYENTIYETIVLVIFKLFMATIYREETSVTNDDISFIEAIIFKVFYQTEKWNISKILYGYLRKVRFSENCGYKEIFDVNYMCCLKALGEKDELKQHLSRFNVQNLSPIYKVAKSLISDNYTNINDQIESIYIGINKEKSDYICAKDIMEWPLFRDYLKTDEFAKFKESHNDDFKLYDTNDQEFEDEKKFKAYIIKNIKSED